MENLTIGQKIYIYAETYSGGNIDTTGDKMKNAIGNMDKIMRVRYLKSTVISGVDFILIQQLGALKEFSHYIRPANIMDDETYHRLRGKIAGNKFGF